MNLLSIGGSDPSSGAGIQSDVRLLSSLDAHCLTVITAITSQNTSGFGVSEPVSKRILKSQLDHVMSDFKIDGIKIGMVYDSDVIKVLYKQLREIKVPIVVDPVIRSTTGGRLIKNSAIKDLQKFLVPLATAITPNRFEAEILSGAKIDRDSPETAAKTIQNMGAENTIITGITSKSGRISDFVLGENGKYWITGDVIPRINHGSGCNYSAVLLFALAKRKGIRESARFARQMAYNSIKDAKKIGRGVAITHIHKDRIGSELLDAIAKFARIKNVYKAIPECQTNFVYSKPKPGSTKEILGVSGRIVKAGRMVTVAGDLTYGGSKHVGTALLTMSRKFPEIRSAINLKYRDETVSRIRKSGLAVASYDRMREPKNLKARHSTIAWGIQSAIGDSKEAPDAVYHKGDFGKEPMIIIFGETPGSVLKKISEIL